MIDPSSTLPEPTLGVASSEKMLTYYQESGPDYRTWSKAFNMHFGFYQWPGSPFRREAMLRNMNTEVLNRLLPNPGAQVTVADLGCGVGATLRQAAVQYPNAQLYGVTIVPSQARQGRTLTDEKRISLLMEDFTDTSFPDNSLDGVYAIESSCYASGPAKADLLREIYRILKPGGRFVIADGFLRHQRPLTGLAGWAYRRLCQSWVLGELACLPDLLAHASVQGFSNLQAEDISWRVAPSVAHVPGTVAQFLFKQALTPTLMTQARWDNLKGPLLTMILGLHQQHFGYFLVSGTK